MGMGTRISWCDATFNPWIGCTKVSAGCKHCYAENMMDTRWGKVEWGPEGERVRTSESYWRQPLKWNRQAEAEGRRYRVFCASLADVFEDHGPNLFLWRRDLWELIAETPNLDWLLLTKRPEKVVDFVPWRWMDEQWPANVWIGVSVEDQETANKRIPELLRIPAAVHFLSCEPLLGPIGLLDAGALEAAGPEWAGINSLVDWVIVGGESGNSARKMDVAWVEDLVEQCRAAGVPVFVKQMGSVWAVSRSSDRKGGNLSDFPERLQVREFPNGHGAAGRLLDGREWNQFPEAVEQAGEAT